MAEPEVFIEYATRYAGREPGRRAWTSSYDEAMRDFANRLAIHGPDAPHPIGDGRMDLVQRTVTIITSDWIPAVKPDPDQDEIAERATRKAVTELHTEPDTVIFAVPVPRSDIAQLERDAQWDGKGIPDYLVDHAMGRTRKGC